MIKLKSKDGKQYVLRPLTKNDKVNLVEGLKKMSAESIYNRFHGFKKEFNEKELTKLTDLDGVDRFAFALVEVDSSGEREGLGIVRYHRSTNQERAEFAITLIDRVQGKGLSKQMVKELIKVAKRNKVKFLDGTLESTNSKMKYLINSLPGFTIRPLGGGLLKMEADLSFY